MLWSLLYTNKKKISQSQHVKKLASLFLVHSHKIIAISKVVEKKNANERQFPYLNATVIP